MNIYFIFPRPMSQPVPCHATPTLENQMRLILSNPESNQVTNELIAYY